MLDNVSRTHILETMMTTASEAKETGMNGETVLAQFKAAGFVVLGTHNAWRNDCHVTFYNREAAWRVLPDGTVAGIETFSQPPRREFPVSTGWHTTFESAVEVLTGGYQTRESAEAAYAA